MRFLQAVLFLVFLGAVGVFAIQNTSLITVHFGTWDYSGPVALFTIIAYLLGMLSGWMFAGVLKRSWRRVVEPERY